MVVLDKVISIVFLIMMLRKLAYSIHQITRDELLLIVARCRHGV